MAKATNKYLETFKQLLNIFFTKSPPKRHECFVVYVSFCQSELCQNVRLIRKSFIFLPINVRKTILARFSLYRLCAAIGLGAN